MADTAAFTVGTADSGGGSGAVPAPKLICECIKNELTCSQIVFDMKQYFKLLFQLSLLKTLRFNLFYFPLKQALRLPVLVYKGCSFYKMKGKIRLDCPVRPAILRLGENHLSISDTRFSRTIWDVSGMLILNGKASIGSGSKISIGKNGVLSLGSAFCISGETEIVCHKHICFGDDCLLSWDSLVMDTDFHQIVDSEGNTLNPPADVSIADHVWIGCRCLILKGVSIPSGSVIAAGSVITSNFDETDTVIAGQGSKATVIKSGIRWIP